MNRKNKRALNKKINVLEEIIKIIKQYFPELINLFENLSDSRCQAYVKYNLKVIFMVRLLGWFASIKSMHELTREFNTEEAIQNIAKICELDLDELPHCDTINDVFEKIKIEELEDIIYHIVNKLIRKKMFDKYKIRNEYFHVVVDGTGLATSRKKYNESCLVKNKTDKNGNEYKEYSTYVLEAKLVVGDMVFSIGSEFVENTDENESKQDCEINAFKRLAKKIKKRFPKLKIIIGADALYAKKTIFEICEKYNWKYIIRFKDGSIPTLYKEFENLVKLNNESNISNYDCVTGIEYDEFKVNIIRYRDTEKETEFTYITNLTITNNNLERTINVGRNRWKIENEGFNMQKNGTFNIGHLCSRNANAIKVHYLMVQIAHIIRQLFEKGSIQIKELGLKITEISQKIKTSLISKTLNLTEHKKIQLRFE